jgi:hypothetical protein
MSKIFIVERRTKKSWIQSRVLGLLIFDDESCKPQKKRIGTSENEGVEGSRFEACPKTGRHFALSHVRPGDVKAGGSRKLPSAMLSPSVLSDQANRANQTLGHSREPPVLTRFSQNRR